MSAKVLAFLIVSAPILPFLLWMILIIVRHRRRMREIERLSDWRNHLPGAKP